MSITAPPRESPAIPNHEMLRVIGRGAYGEIWLARSLTGAFRAVKIVDERTFESKTAFHREFEGMARFEPISRSDPGFVNILHVGRDPGGHFFYYVMELADDAAGASMDPALYLPKTLRSELRGRLRIPADECVEIGLSLSRALGVLHRHGLVHRDIKPANIIFVRGAPKIADIGLVAASGQESYVGTEGYVPPEGPGSVRADLFSLGKVLYEMAMGKDRMEFPALHSEITALPDRERLMRLNGLLLRACASSPAERYPTAEELHADLERIRGGARPGRRSKRATRSVGLAGVAAFALAAGLWWRQSTQPGSVTVTAEPAGAMVVLAGSGQVRRSPAHFENVPSGTHFVHVMLAGHDPVDAPLTVDPKEETVLPPIRLKRSLGSAVLSSVPEGADFVLRQGENKVAEGHCPATAANLPTGEYEAVFTMAGREMRRPLEIARGENAAATVEFCFAKISIGSDPAGAGVTVDHESAGQTPLEITLLQGAHEIAAAYRGWPAQVQKVELGKGEAAPISFNFAPGSVKITSSPAGAAVLAGGREIGKTPLLLENLEPGPLEYEVRSSGYKSHRLTGEVKPGQQTFLAWRLVQREGPAKGRDWENSLQMKFKPVGEILVGTCPVRVREYDAFCQATGRTRIPPDFVQDGGHPAVNVNWEDCAAFCEWLTQKEARAGMLEPGQLYRLPTDREWSDAAGLVEEDRATPEERDGKAREYPWGRQWPPPPGAGNYADAALKGKNSRIAGYRDGFAQTSPVGSFAANSAGLYDMGGNVWQWVSDSYNGQLRGKDWGVLRGGSWGTSAPAELRSSYRNVIDRSERDVIFGFRVILAPEP